MATDEESQLLEEARHALRHLVALVAATNLETITPVTLSTLKAMVETRDSLLTGLQTECDTFYAIGLKWDLQCVYQRISDGDLTPDDAYDEYETILERYGFAPDERIEARIPVHRDLDSSHPDQQQGGESASVAGRSNATQATLEEEKALQRRHEREKRERLTQYVSLTAGDLKYLGGPSDAARQVAARIISTTQKLKLSARTLHDRIKEYEGRDNSGARILGARGKASDTPPTGFVAEDPVLSLLALTESRFIDFTLRGILLLRPEVVEATVQANALAQLKDDGEHL